MIGFQNQVPPEFLTLKSNLGMLMRALFRMGLDYCVLPSIGDYANTIIFTKDQLASLIERSSSDAFIAEISKRVDQGHFRPVATFKSDSSSGDFISNGGFTEPERLQVLFIEEDGAKVLSLKEALAPRIPDFPEWWEAPVPFAMYGYGRLHVNHTALLMFGSDLKRMSINDIPDKNEFLVTLEGGESPCSVTFRRLEGDIFVLEDSTSDMSTAEEVAWWAAVGKAWAVSLDLEKRSYRRCDEEEAEFLRAQKNLVLSCEWGGELLGYFCVENKSGASQKERSGHTAEPKKLEKKQASKKQAKQAVKQQSKKVRALKQQTVKEQAEAVETPSGSLTETSEKDALAILGPQTLGLLVPGISYPAFDTITVREQVRVNEQENMIPAKKKPVKKDKL